METEALDPIYVAEILSQPPFGMLMPYAEDIDVTSLSFSLVTISGVDNVRDIAAPGIPMKARLVFRGAEISGITDKGQFVTFACATKRCLLPHNCW